MCGGGTKRRLWRISSLASLASLALAIATSVCLPFDGLYGQDAYAYFRYAASIWPHVSAGAPLPEFYWPVGYPVTVALWLPFTGGAPLAGQIVSAVSCALAAAATSQIVRHVQRDSRASDTPRPDTRTGDDGGPELVAGLVVGLSGASLRYGQVVMADGLGLGATAIATICLVRYAQSGRGSWLIGCAAAASWGLAARWMGSLLVLPLGAYLAFGSSDACRRRLQRLHEPSASPTSVLPWAVAAVVVGLVIALPVIAIGRASPTTLQKHEWLVGWSWRNAFHRDFHTPEGHAVYRLPPILFYLVRLAWPDYFCPLFVPFAVAGAWRLLRQRRLADIALLVGWPATVCLFLSGIPYENPRFLLPTLPSIGALVGLGFAQGRTSLPTKWRPALTATIVVSVLAGLGFGAREHARLVARKNADRDLVTWLGSRLPGTATLLVGGPTLTLQRYGAFATCELYSAGDAEVTTLLAATGPLFVLADVAALKHQWIGLPPDQIFERLRASPGLTVVDVHSPYTLFQANKP